MYIMNIVLNSVFFFVLGIVTCVVAAFCYLWFSDFSVISLFRCLLDASISNHHSLSKPQR